MIKIIEVGVATDTKIGLMDFVYYFNKDASTSSEPMGILAQA